MRRFIVLTPLVFLLCLPLWGQRVGVKTNLLYTGLTYTPNLGAELALNSRWTLEVWGGYNPFNLKGSPENNEKLVHSFVMPELRYWSCQRFNGHYFGFHGLYTSYNISGKNLPLLFGSDSAKYRFQGKGMGAGLSYGYQWVLGKHWNVEFTLGAGAIYLTYDRYACAYCGDKLAPKASKLYYGPTKAGVSLIYLIK